MNNCPVCNHMLVEIFYGIPNSRQIALAKQDLLALGGTFNHGHTHYCYGCNLATSWI